MQIKNAISNSLYLKNTNGHNILTINWKAKKVIAHIFNGEKFAFKINTKEININKYSMDQAYLNTCGDGA